jgi:hypothetical protein
LEFWFNGTFRPQGNAERGTADPFLRFVLFQVSGFRFHPSSPMSNDSQIDLCLPVVPDQASSDLLILRLLGLRFE